MKFVYPHIDFVFDTECGKVNTLVIENQPLFTSVLSDIRSQLSGNDGVSVLSQSDKIISISKNLELLDSFVPFELNSKTIVSRIAADLESKAVSDDFYIRTAETVSRVEALLDSLAFDYSCDIDFTKIDIGAIIKASGIIVRSSHDSLAEKVLDYFELITEFVGKKLFVTVNLRCYISDKQAELFAATVLSHGYHLIMIEGFEHERIPNENRLVVDSDLCLIM